MKAKHLVKIIDAVEWVRRWGWLMVLVGFVLLIWLSYRKSTRQIRETQGRVEKMHEQIQDLEAARINVAAALENLRLQETIIIEKYANEKVKISRLTSSELQQFADSLYNAGR